MEYINTCVNIRVKVVCCKIIVEGCELMFTYKSKYIFNYRGDGINLSKDQIVVYHYTSPEGFLEILKGQKLRFTDIRYMNDRSEGIYFVKLLLEYIENNRGTYPFAENVVNGLLSQNDFEEIKSLKISTIKYKTDINTKARPARAFLFCTCCDADSLNMWNYYVKNGAYQGYNIGVKVESFLKEIDNQLPNKNNVSIYYGKVLYNKKEQQNEIKNLLETLENAISKNTNSFQSKYLATLTLKRYIDLYGVFYKHHQFSDEKEYRFVIEVDIDADNNVGNDLIALSSEKSDINEDFCIRNGVVTPFLVVPFSKDTISRIYISPMTEYEIAKSSIRELIDLKNYKNIQIHKSSIPIRY